jgi:hypothetical protein
MMYCILLYCTVLCCAITGCAVTVTVLCCIVTVALYYTQLNGCVLRSLALSYCYILLVVAAVAGERVKFGGYDLR